MGESAHYQAKQSLIQFQSLNRSSKLLLIGLLKTLQHPSIIKGHKTDFLFSTFTSVAVDALAVEKSTTGGLQRSELHCSEDYSRILTPLNGV